MAAIVNKDDCTGCGACLDSCPLDAITMGDDDNAFIDPETCGGCGACLDACPVEAITMD